MGTVNNKPHICVIGMGGGGSNAVESILSEGVCDITCIVCNTDAQALELSSCSNKIQLGPKLTKGLGAGADPHVGKMAAEESMRDVIDMLEDVDLLFITAGMGGGTGTGAAPAVAKVARDKGILTVGVVTLPFAFEGSHRQKIAHQGVLEMEKCVDTLLVIPNQNLFRLSDTQTTFANAFKMADSVLSSGVRTFTDLMIKPGIVNLDFADVSAVMRSFPGKAMMGSGEAKGEGRALEAAKKAIACPLLEDAAITYAQAAIINICGNTDITLYEVDEIVNTIKKDIDNDKANIIFGVTYDEHMQDSLRVSLVATGVRQDISVGTVVEEQKSMMPKISPKKTEPAPIASVATSSSAAVADDDDEEDTLLSSATQREDSETPDTNIKKNNRQDSKKSLGSSHGGSMDHMSSQPFVEQEVESIFVQEDSDAFEDTEQDEPRGFWDRLMRSVEKKK